MTNLRETDRMRGRGREEVEERERKKGRKREGMQMSKWILESPEPGARQLLDIQTKVKILI